ncbi:MAG TPA: hypothetical protein VJX67_25290 [Blastocatellia bacterium]|nr:hypothetical protein [Blastocatellia bacterium]
MKKRLCVIVLSVLTMAGCTFTGELYPVQGPLSTQPQSPVLLAKIRARSLNGFTPTDISVVLTDGEVCKGRWTEVPKGATTADISLPGGSMSSAWDAVYGSGFYVAHVLGATLYFRAVAIGSRGTLLEVEVFRPLDTDYASNWGHVKGVARDNKGNIYKLAF